VVLILVVAAMAGCAAKERGQITGMQKVLDSGTTSGAGPVLLDKTLALYRNGKAWNREPELKGSAPAGPHSYLLFHFLQMRTAGWKDVDLDDVVVLSGAAGPARRPRPGRPDPARPRH
jgi:hypothetical protein